MKHYRIGMSLTIILLAIFALLGCGGSGGGPSNNTQGTTVANDKDKQEQPK